MMPDAGHGGLLHLHLHLHLVPLALHSSSIPTVMDYARTCIHSPQSLLSLSVMAAITVP